MKHWALYGKLVFCGDVFVVNTSKRPCACGYFGCWGGWGAGCIVGGMLTFIATATTLHFHTYVMLRCCTFSCASTHTSCYAARSLALPRIHHATLLHVLLHFHTYVILRCCTFSCTSSICHATLLHVFFHFHAYVMLRCCTFSFTSTHTSCYELEQLAMLMVAMLGKEIN